MIPHILRVNKSFEKKLFVFVYMYCVCVCMCVSVHMWRSEVSVKCVLSCFPPLFLRGSLTGPEAHSVG